jgi:hypothetical protein
MQNGGFFDVIRAFTHLLNPSNHFLKVLYTLHSICTQDKNNSDTNQSTSNLNTFSDIKNSPYLRRQLIEKATNKGIEYFLLTETELKELEKYSFSYSFCDKTITTYSGFKCKETKNGLDAYFCYLDSTSFFDWILRNNRDDLIPQEKLKEPHPYGIKFIIPKYYHDILDEYKKKTEILRFIPKFLQKTPQIPQTGIQSDPFKAPYENGH